ncbi:MAG: DUF3574 domain-containing protein [Methylococcaceae bacterium]
MKPFKYSLLLNPNKAWHTSTRQISNSNVTLPLVLPRTEHGGWLGLMAMLVLASGCAGKTGLDCQPHEQSYIVEHLYFGTQPSNNNVVTPHLWSDFLETSVTSRFPDGLSTWQASGQWRGKDEVLVHESTYILNVLHPDDEPSETAIRAISNEYKQRFKQEAVLRVKSWACVSF